MIQKKEKKSEASKKNAGLILCFLSVSYEEKSIKSDKKFEKI